MTGFLCKTSQITRVEVSFWLVVWDVEGNISTYFKHFESMWRYSGHHLLILQLPSSVAGFRSLLVDGPGPVEGEIDKLRALLGAVEADSIFRWKSKIWPKLMVSECSINAYYILLLCINEVWDGQFNRLLAGTCSSQGSDASPLIEWPFLSIYSPCLLCTPGFVADVLKFVGELPISFTFSWAFSWFQPFHPFSVDCS